MTELRFLRDLESRASEIRHDLTDFVRRPYSASAFELEKLLVKATNLWMELQVHRQAALLPAPPLVRGVPLQDSGPAASSSAGPGGGFDA
jgi:hypothetical protein